LEKVGLSNVPSKKAPDAFNRSILENKKIKRSNENKRKKGELCPWGKASKRERGHENLTNWFVRGGSMLQKGGGGGKRGKKKILGKEKGCRLFRNRKSRFEKRRLNNVEGALWEKKFG